MWPFRRLRPERLDRLPLERVRNEIAQLASIRDDASRVARGSPLHQWLNGAIFALEWVADPYQSLPPSVPAHKVRLGVECDLPSRS